MGKVAREVQPSCQLTVDSTLWAPMLPASHPHPVFTKQPCFWTLLCRARGFVCETKCSVLDLQESSEVMLGSGRFSLRWILEVESGGGGGVVTSTLGETIPLGDVSKGFSIPHTSL